MLAPQSPPPLHSSSKLPPPGRDQQINGYQQQPYPGPLPPHTDDAPNMNPTTSSLKWSDNFGFSSISIRTGFIELKKMPIFAKLQTTVKVGIGNLKINIEIFVSIYCQIIISIL
jgi:hypothetical protein